MMTLLKSLLSVWMSELHATSGMGRVSSTMAGDIAVPQNAMRKRCAGEGVQRRLADVRWSMARARRRRR